MAHIVFIHGIANKPPADLLLQQWREALAADSGIELQQSACTSEMVYWADVLYAAPLPSATEEASLAVPSADESQAAEQLSRAIGESPEQAVFLAGLAGKFSAVELLATGAAPTPGQPAGQVQERVPLPWSIKEPVMARFLRDVHHYLFNVEFSPRSGTTYRVQDEIRQRFVQALERGSNASSPLLVVSHSMGTVIAYDCLKRLVDCPKIGGLMTIGSPLGLDEVQDKLRSDHQDSEVGWTREKGFPSRTLGDGQWTNVFDALDPVAGFDPRLANDFNRDGRPVIFDIHEPTYGWWRHDINKYLRGPQLRSALATMLNVDLSESRIAGLASKSRRTATSLSQRVGTLSSLQREECAVMDSNNVALPPDAIVPELLAVIAEGQLKRVALICDQVARALYHGHKLLDLEKAQHVLSQLRNKRMLFPMAQLADALIQNGLDAPQIRRQYAQGLIDRAGRLAESGAVSAALCILNGIIKGEEDADEVNEARGLIGRVHKQAYVNTANDNGATSLHELERALKAYYQVYLSDPHKYTWHGINVVALLARAERDGIPQPAFPPFKKLAQRILSTLAGVNNRSLWSSATKAEAFIALGNYGSATDMLKDYARDTRVSAFELNSFLRQLVEVWQFTSSDDKQAPIILLLHSELMKRDGGRMEITRDHLDMQPLLKLAREGKLEKVFGEDGFQTLKWYKLGLSRCSCVARFETKTGRGMGTGFAVDGSQLHPSLDGRTLVITNAHVLSDDPNDQPALRSDQAQISFECALDAGKRYGISRIIWTSPPGQLDATLVELTEKIDVPDAIGSWYPVNPKQSKVYLIGHPLGGGLSLSLHDNKFLAYREPKLQYRTPSEPGSSGSPVFDEQWQFIGLHHAGSFEMPRIDGQPGTIEANEGVSLAVIQAAIAKSLGGAGVPAPMKIKEAAPILRRAVWPPGDAAIRLADFPKPATSNDRTVQAPIVNYASIVGILGGGGTAVRSDNTALHRPDTAQRIVESAAEAVERDPRKRAALVAEFNSSLIELAHEAAAEGESVITTPRNRFASIMQTVLAERAATTDGRVLEFAFDKGDTAEALMAVFAAAKDRRVHDQLHPSTTKPESIADDAQVFLVSDFGTGMYGAPVIAATIASSGRKFELLMHLGDIYYSGQPDEVKKRFLDLWPIQAGRISRNLNGNHDMYSGGYGYFDVCMPAFAQSASYFALQNTCWLLVCLDTSYKDNNIGKRQLAWVNEVVRAAGNRKLILFSHHPLFSNFKEQGTKLAKKLHELLQSRRITAWYWGHEHHCAIYERHSVYGFYGRCLGHGGMPYKRNKVADFPVDAAFAADLNPGELEWRKCGEPLTPTVHYLDGPNPYITEAPNKYGPHGYMTIAFAAGSLVETLHDASGNPVYQGEIR